MGNAVQLRLKFGRFEADLESGELFREGHKLAVQEKPFQILALLLESPSHFVAREEIFAKLWTNVQARKDQSLNTAIRRLRLVLEDGDSGAHAIETVGSRGYRLTLPVTSASPGGEDRLAPRRLRLAVAPFANLDPDSPDYFSDGLTEQMIVQLGHVCQDISVIAPISSLRFKENAQALSRMAEDLRADYMLSGTVSRLPQRLRITAKLIRAADRSCVWTESYTRQDTDVFFVQDDIARNIVRAVLVAIPAPRAPLAHLTTTAAIYEKYLKACFFANKFIDPDFGKALSLFEEVIAEDPDFAPGHASLAHMYSAMGQYGGMPPQAVCARIKSAAEKALALCEELPDAHTALGLAQAFYDADWGAAEASFLRALQLNPSSSGAYLGYAQLLMLCSRHREAVEAAQRARDLDPLSPIVNSILVVVLYLAGKFEEGLERGLKCIEIAPEFATAHACLGWIYEGLKAVDQAAACYRAAVERGPGSPLMWAHCARGAALIGDRDEATRILDDLLRQREATHVPCTWIALVYAALGQEEGVLQWSELAMRERCGWRALFAVDPRLTAFSANPRYQMLVRDLGLASPLPQK
jgi:TolB-like protein/Tfp pilus assembly protein PilF